MTDLQAPRIYLPGVAVLLFIVSPLLMLVGGFLARVNARYDFEWAVNMTIIGTVVFWIGVAALMSALILEGVRSVAQQQLNILRVERGED